MKRFVRLMIPAACVSLLSLAGCSSSAAPHPQGVAVGFGSALRDFSAPKHVLTMISEDVAGQLDPRVAARYVDYVGVGTGDANAFHDAGIKTMFYTDPNRSHVGTPMYTKDEATFAHDCNGKRITVGHRPVTTYQMDVRSPALEPLWAKWVAGVLDGGYKYNYIFEDGANNVHNDSAVPCGYTEPTWTAASNANDVALGQPIIYHGLGTLGDGYSEPPPSILLNPTTVGGLMEDCYVKDNRQRPKSRTSVWKNYETTELTMISAQRLFFCRDLIAFPAKSSLDQRMYMFASFLLTYDPSSSVLSEKFSTPSKLEVFPEETLVALDPIIKSPTQIGQLKTSLWTYGRQYGACYLWGRPIGKCAAVVNSDNPTSSHPFPWPGGYSHTLVLNGGGILDGGTASVTGPAPGATIAGNTAEIAIQ